ncbi:MAG TPA: MFS transporter, partial [Rhodospirillales bacterium]|nr:MFS transporter [Rhodospirillales bacterium]
AMWSRRAFGWGPEQNGYLFAFVGLISAAVQGGLVGRLAHRFGERHLITAGSALLALGMLAIPIAGTPSLNSMVSLAVDPAVQGGTMGVSRSATTMARVLGPGFAGLLFELLGKDWPFFAGALIMCVVLAIAFGAPSGRRAAARSAEAE